VQVAGFTRDGIPVRGEVEIEFQIRQLTRIKPEQGAQESQRFRSFYTFSWEGVLNAVYNAPVRNGDVVPPGEMITEEVSYWFRRIVESYNFEELIGFYPEESPSERVRLAPPGFRAAFGTETSLRFKESSEEVGLPGKSPPD